jgi:hypothetical protein
MKKLISLLAAAGLVTGIAFAQSADYSIREVRDPVQFQEKLNTDMTTIGARLTAAETSVGTNQTLGVTVGSLTTTGIVTISEGKLADSIIVSADIKDGVIVNADISASAAISATKIGAGSWMTGSVTNQGVGSTNVTWYVGGMVVSNTFNPQ